MPSIWPVTQLFSGSSSHAIPDATSSARPILPNACIAAEAFIAASFDVIRAASGVSTRPGAMYGIRSTASASGSLIGGTTQAVSATLAELLPGTIYHFRVAAKEDLGMGRVECHAGLPFEHANEFVPLGLRRIEAFKSVPVFVLQVELAKRVLRSPIVGLGFKQGLPRSDRKIELLQFLRIQNRELGKQHSATGRIAGERHLLLQNRRKLFPMLLALVKLFQLGKSFGVGVVKLDDVFPKLDRDGSLLQLLGGELRDLRPASRLLNGIHDPGDFLTRPKRQHSQTRDCAHHKTTSEDIPPPLSVVNRKKARPARFIMGMAMLSDTNSQSASQVTKPGNGRSSERLCFRMACMMPRDQR